MNHTQVNNDKGDNTKDEKLEPTIPIIPPPSQPISKSQITHNRLQTKR